MPIRTALILVDHCVVAWPDAVRSERQRCVYLIVWLQSSSLPSPKAADCMAIVKFDGLPFPPFTVRRFPARF